MSFTYLPLQDVPRTYGYTDLILGGWGCVVFGSDPQNIANIFKKEINNCERIFETGCFTIADWFRERRFLRLFAIAFSSKG
jgi:uncharacterized protein (TIGR02452 family)